MSVLAMGLTARDRSRLPALAYLLALLGVGATAVISPLIVADTDSTYAGAATWLLWLEVVASIALLALPVLEPEARWGALLGVAGASWLVPELAGWLGGPAGLRTISDAWARLLAATVVVATVLRFARGLHRRRLVQVALCGGAASAVARTFLVDPFLDQHCWRSCEANPLAWPGLAGPRGWSAGHWVDVTGSVLVAGVVAVAAFLTLVAGRGNPQHDHRGTVPAWALAGGVAAPGVLRMASTESATSPAFLVCFVLTQLAAVWWGALLVRDRLAQWRLRSRLTRLAVTVGVSARAGSLTPAMRKALRDVGLDVAFWAPARSGWVDASGHGVDVPVAATAERRVTVVTRNGDPVASLIHSRRVDASQVERALGPALRLALENEQLRAATLAELGELQQSRIRIIERAALERRRLERNLHDGAQQRVVSLALLVRMLAQRVEQVEPVEGAGSAQAHAGSALAAQAELLTRATVEELRRVARGIYPAVLADSGLAGALLDLADSSTDLPISLDALPRRRYTGTVETTAYLVVAAAIADARRGRATWLQVGCAESDGELRLDISGDVRPDAAASLADLADQVGALAGTLRVESDEADGWVRLVLPCES